MINDLNLSKAKRFRNRKNNPCNNREANRSHNSGDRYSANKIDQFPVIIYQMGKVGSTSVMHSLNRLGIPNQHVHRLSWQGIKHAEERLINAGIKKLPVRNCCWRATARSPI